MGTNKTGSNDATMKLEYIIKLQVCLEKMNHMSYLELKHTADSVSYIDSLERNHQKNQSTENTVELELTHQALFQVTTNILYLTARYNQCLVSESCHNKIFYWLKWQLSIISQIFCIFKKIKFSKFIAIPEMFEKYVTMCVITSPLQKKPTKTEDIYLYTTVKPV